MEILSKSQSKLLGRTEITSEIKHFGKPTPSFKEVKDLVLSKEKSSPELVKVKEVKGSYGSGSSKSLVYIYNSKEDYEKLEGKIEAPKEEKKEEVKETPKEEVKTSEEPKENKEDGKEEKTE